MVVVLVSILAGPMVVKTGQDHGPAGAATGRRSEGITETRAFSGEPVDMGGPDDRIAIDAGVLTMVIRHKKNHIPGGAVHPNQHRRRTKQDLEKLQFWRGSIEPWSAWLNFTSHK